MIAFLRELMTKIGFRAAYFLGCEHLEDGGHTPKIVVLVSTEEVDMDYFCFLFINSSLKFEIMAKQLYVASQRVL